MTTSRRRPSPLSRRRIIKTGSTTLQMSSLDDATAAYVLAMRNPFRASAPGRLAACWPDGSRRVGCAQCRRASDARPRDRGTGGSRRPGALGKRRRAGARQHHRLHLLRANRALAAALAAARQHVSRDEAAIDKIMVPLHAAYRELQWAALALPGFEIVALSQGCCAAHAAGRMENYTNAEGEELDGGLFDLGARILLGPHGAERADRSRRFQRRHDQAALVLRAHQGPGAAPSLSTSATTTRTTAP